MTLSHRRLKCISKLVLKRSEQSALGTYVHGEKLESLGRRWALCDGGDHEQHRLHGQTQGGGIPEVRKEPQFFLDVLERCT